jgi:hypothetical protein
MNERILHSPSAESFMASRILYRDTANGSEAIGTSVAPFDEVIAHCFPFETKLWQQTIADCIKHSLVTMAQTVHPDRIKKSQKPQSRRFATLTGSVARKLLNPEYNYQADLESLKIYFQALANFGSDLPDIVRQAIAGMNPYDLDIKLPPHSNIEIIYASLQAKTRLSNGLHALDLGNLKVPVNYEFIPIGTRTVLKIVFRPPEGPEFCIDVANRPKNSDEKFSDYRAGPQQSTVRANSVLDVSMFDNGETMEVGISGTPHDNMLAEEFARRPNQNLGYYLGDPENGVIVDMYANQAQKILTLLSAIRIAFQASEKNEPYANVPTYNAPVNLHHLMNINGGNQKEIEPFRIQEMVREGLVCLSLRPKTFIRLLKRNGLDYALGCVEELSEIERMTEEDIRDSLASERSFLINCAKMFNPYHKKTTSFIDAGFNRPTQEETLQKIAWALSFVGNGAIPLERLLQPEPYHNPNRSQYTLRDRRFVEWVIDMDEPDKECTPEDMFKIIGLGGNAVGYVVIVTDKDNHVERYAACPPGSPVTPQSIYSVILQAQAPKWLDDLCVSRFPAQILAAAEASTQPSGDHFYTYRANDLPLLFITIVKSPNGKLCAYIYHPVSMLPKFGMKILRGSFAQNQTRHDDFPNKNP